MPFNDSSKELRLAELLGALSHALDMTEGQPQGHSVRCCWIAMRVAQELGLSEQALSELYYTVLLKDLGCSSNAARICQLYLTDDISFKHDFKFIDGSLSQALRFVLTHTGVEAGLAQRVRAIITTLQNGGEIATSLIETRCHRGADIATMMGFSNFVAAGILSLDEHWNGKGQPTGLAGEDIPIQSQIALLAQVVDVFQFNTGPQAASEEIRGRSGNWFSPDLVAAFERASAAAGFWEGLKSDNLETAVYSLEPANYIRQVGESQLDHIAAGFAKVIDSKSPHTAGHSERVTLFSDIIASEMNYSDRDRQLLKRAALLHDIGKLGVSNSVLDKPGKLDDEEWQQMRMHPVHSDSILSRVSAFSNLTPIVRGHHERLDGKGYPDGLAGDQISMETRIVTVADIFDALTADRPYREAMPTSKALSILESEVGTAIDGRCLEALKIGMGRINWSLAA